MILGQPYCIGFAFNIIFVFAEKAEYNHAP